MNNQKPYIVCFGEVLWDIYADGKKLGGAPFNVAAHATQLDTAAYIISKIGNDELGTAILDQIENRQVPTDFVRLDYTFDTGVVNVALDQEGKPSYDIKQPSAWDFIHIEEKEKLSVQNASALVYGSLACRTSQSRRSLFELLEISTVNICDLNIRLSFDDEALIESLLRTANVLKINNEEAELLIELFGLDTSNFYQDLSDRFSIHTIVQTLGPDGAEAFHEGQLFKVPGEEIEVVDTVGSGDAFLAAFIHFYLTNNSMPTCLEYACRLGAFVATQPGAIPIYSRNQIFSHNDTKNHY